MEKREIGKIKFGEALQSQPYVTCARLYIQRLLGEAWVWLDEWLCVSAVNPHLGEGTRVRILN